MITAIVIAGAITICLMEMDPAVKKARQQEEMKKRQILFLR